MSGIYLIFVFMENENVKIVYSEVYKTISYRIRGKDLVSVLFFIVPKKQEYIDKAHNILDKTLFELKGLIDEIKSKENEEGNFN